MSMGKERKKKLHLPAVDHLLAEADKFLGSAAEALGGTPQGEGEASALETPAPQSERETAGPAQIASPAKQEQGAVPPPPLDLEIAGGGLQAVVRMIYPQTTQEEVIELLRDNGVVFGLDEEAIQQAVAKARKTGQPLRNVVVASGTSPRPPAVPRLEYCLSEGVEALPALEPLHKLLGVRERGEAESGTASLYAWMVKPGTRLAVKVGEEGEGGVSVQGRTVPPPALALSSALATRFLPGAGVELAPNGCDYLAATFGCAGLLGGQVAVLAPIWVAPDGMEACFLNLPLLPGSSAPAPDEVRAALRAAGVVAGLDEAALASLVENAARAAPKARLILLARGTPPPPPRDALPVFHFEYGLRAGAFRPDGAFDFRERNFFPAVQEDALLVERAPPVPGAPGQTVRGEEIPVAAPVRAELVPGENVRLEVQDGAQRLYAQAEGGARVQTMIIRTAEGQTQQYLVAVLPVTQISGNVDYATGNLDIRGNALISGSITTGFRVVATGDITVAAGVEEGAEVRAGGNVTVKQGIFGAKTYVKAGGTVTAKFVHEARIEAGADVVVGSYIHGAVVHAGGQVQVEGLGGSGGGIVKGMTWAARGIAARNIGSATILCGIMPESFARAEQLRKTIRQAEAILQNLLKAIGLTDLSAEAVRRLTTQHPARKPIILHYIKKAHPVAQVREKCLAELRVLGTRFDQEAQGAVIDVAGTIHSQTLVQIGNKRITLAEDLKRVRFYLDLDERAVRWKDLAGTAG